MAQFSGRSARTLIAATASIALLGLTGCTGDSSGKSNEPPLSAVSAADLKPITSDYADEVAAAVAASDPPGYATTGWQKVDTGVALAAVQRETRFRKVTGAGESDYAPALYDGTAWASNSDSWPKTMLLRQSEDTDTKGIRGYDLFIQEGEGAPWKRATTVYASNSDLPNPVTDAGTPDAAEGAAAVATQVVKYWQSGEGEEGMRPGGEVVSERDLDIDRQRLTKATFDAGPWVLPWVNSTYLLPAEGGVLAVTDYHLTAVVDAQPGKRLDRKDPVWKLRESTPTQVTLHWAASTLTFIPDEGQPKIIGDWVEEIEPR